MTTNAEVTKNQNESNLNLIRRFTKRLQGAKTLKKARGQRFFSRPSSKFKKRDSALKRIAKRQKIERLRKLGKIK